MNKGIDTKNPYCFTQDMLIMNDILRMEHASAEQANVQLKARIAQLEAAAAVQNGKLEEMQALLDQFALKFET